jgi:hypothetical protein
MRGIALAILACGWLAMAVHLEWQSYIVEGKEISGKESIFEMSVKVAAIGMSICGAASLTCIIFGV